MTHPPAGPPGPPWTPYPSPGAQPPPPPSGKGWKIVAGIAIGGIAAVMLPLMSLGVADTAGLGFGALFVGLLAVPVVGIGLMFSPPTRPWGLGLLIGWALAVIVVGGACVAILSSLA